MEVIRVTQLWSYPRLPGRGVPMGTAVCGGQNHPNPCWGAPRSKCDPSRLETRPQTPVPRPGSGPASSPGLDLCSMPAEALYSCSRQR